MILICDFTRPISENIIVTACDGTTTGTTTLGGTWSIDPATKCLIYLAGSHKGRHIMRKSL